MSGSLFSSLLVVVMLLNFYCIGASRLRALIRAVSLQGVVLGLMPLLVHGSATADLPVLHVVVSLVTALIKGVVIPQLLLRALRALPIKREVEPLIGTVPSLVLAALATALAIVFGQRLAPASTPGAALVVATALATVLSGFLLLVTRLKAVTQIVGYLVLENGVFVFGMLLVEAIPFFVELGILLDLVVGIFVMGILIHHIHRDFPTGQREDPS
ncbi:MAG: hydrogenase [Deltaproteobacteria bacterium]|nr:hydrogenase [Deltaproteobacteria bacterium]